MGSKFYSKLLYLCDPEEDTTTENLAPMSHSDPRSTAHNGPGTTPLPQRQQKTRQRR